MLAAANFEFFFDSSKLLEVIPYVEDYHNFRFDIREIDMTKEGTNFAYGI